MSEIRFDRATVTGKNVRRDARGNIIVPASVTRCGVFAYQRADGSTVRELRHPDDVFSQASLASLEGAPVTDGHPSTFVTPDNAHALEVGIANRVRRDGDYVAAELTLRRSNIIGKVSRGEAVELSCGYACDIVAESGEYKGERYDQRQTRVIYNHVATGEVGWGRAGRDVKMRLDASEMLLGNTMGAAFMIRLDSQETDLQRGERMGAERLAQLNSAPRSARDEDGAPAPRSIRLVDVSRQRADEADHDDDDEVDRVLQDAEARFDRAAEDEPARTSPRARADSKFSMSDHVSAGGRPEPRPAFDMNDFIRLPAPQPSPKVRGEPSRQFYNIIDTDEGDDVDAFLEGQRDRYAELAKDAKGR